MIVLTMRKTAFMFLLMCLFIINVGAKQFAFEKKVWLYWDAPQITQAHIFVQACYQRIKIASEKAGFQCILLNQKNVQNYISDYEEKVTKVRQRSYQKAVQHFADLIRFYIIYEHGGIWLDITTVLMQDFTWLQKLNSQKYEYLITNRFSQQPDVLLFYDSRFQNVAEHRIPSPQNQNKTIIYNEFPGYEIWFLAAKKGAPLMQQIMKTYVLFTQMKYPDLKKKFFTEDIFINMQDADAYLSGNFAITYVLQKKQKQLDKSLTVFSNRFTSYEHFKLWSLKSQLGPLSWDNEYFISREEFMFEDLSELSQKGLLFNFFAKLVGDLRRNSVKKLDLLESLFKKMTLQQFLQSQPGTEECSQIKFVVQNTMLSKTFSGTGLLQKQGIRILTKKQNQKWKEYCNKYIKAPTQNWLTQFVDKLQNMQQRSFLGNLQWTKVLETANYEKFRASSWSQQIKMSLRYNQFGLFMLLRIFIRIYKRFFTNLLALTFVCVLLKKIENKRLMRKFNVFQPIFSDLYEDSVSQAQINNFLSKKSEAKKGSLCVQIMHAHLIFAVAFLSISMFFFIDLYGKRDQPALIFAIVLVVFLIQTWLQRSFLNSQKIKDSPLFYNFYKFSQFYINFFVAYLVLNFISRDRFLLYWQSITLGVIGPCLFSILLRLKEGSKFKKIIRLFLSANKKGFHRYLVTFMILILTMNQNLKYLILGRQYLVSYLPYFGMIYIGVLFILLSYESLSQGKWFQALRLGLLLIIWVLDYFSIDKMYLITPEQPRIGRIFMIITMIGIIHLQVGSEKILKNPKIGHKKCLIVVFLNFAFVVYEILLGTLYFHIEQYGTWQIYHKQNAELSIAWVNIMIILALTRRVSDSSRSESTYNQRQKSYEEVSLKQSSQNIHQHQFQYQTQN